MAMRSMKGQPSPVRDRLYLTASRRRAGVALTAALLLATLLGACGASSSATSSAQVKQACKEVGAVLSDGPEPAADPVGYAQAQILPLRQIRTPDRKLHAAINRLATAYLTFVARGGDRAAGSAVKAAAGAVNAICPGAAS